MPEDLTVLTDPEAAGLSRVFGLLADPTRLRVLLLLCAGERNVTELCRLLRLTQPTVSHHLGLLRLGGLVVPRRAGRSIYYALHAKLEFADGCELRIGNASGVTVRIRR